MKDVIRPAGAALAAFAFLAGTGACTTPPPVPEQRFAEAAAAALTDQDTLDEEGTFVLSAAGGIDGSNNQIEITPRTRLLVEAACAGEGSVTLTVTSGSAKTRRHLACAAKPRARTFAFTTHTGSISFDADRDTATHGGLAYLARRPASEHR
ncbi:hypothetical protein [Streptomyces sp. NPDC002994]|uniref:hypothetical protein n=1 Tax=Streptomyces sp. NPDC002994 TaxID=3154441 RepID=UPI0033A6B33C